MENKISTLEVENILIDVRKAYRLLYDYQRKVLDLMKYIGVLTSRRYEGGWCKFSQPSPRDGKGSLDNWAWDWLNLYTYEFWFGNKKINGNEIQLSVWLVSDTGFHDANSKDAESIETFSTVEDSATRLVFVIGKNTWHRSFNDFIPNNLKKDALEYVRKNEKGTLLVKSFNLSGFINADETRNRLQEIVSFCNANGIPEFNFIKDNLSENTTTK